MPGRIGFVEGASVAFRPGLAAAGIELAVVGIELVAAFNLDMFYKFN